MKVSRCLEASGPRLNRVGGEVGELRCENCDFTSRTTGAMGRHSLQHIALAFCYCGKSWINPDSVIRHIRKERGCVGTAGFNLRVKNGETLPPIFKFLVEASGYEKFMDYMKRKFLRRCGGDENLWNTCNLRAGFPDSFPLWKLRSRAEAGADERELGGRPHLPLPSSKRLRYLPDGREFKKKRKSRAKQR